MKNCKLTYLICSLMLMSSAAFAKPEITLCGELAQGKIIKGHGENLQKIRINGANHQVDKNGDFIFALPREQKERAVMEITDKEGNVYSYDLNIAPSHWDIQNIKGLPPRKVTPSKEDQAEIDRERTLVRGALKGDRLETYWKNGFIEPVQGRISGNFGGQRIMNGHKMNPHAGTDIAAPLGTPIKAAGDGIITLTAPNTFYSGNVVVIDHGHGLQTIYAHMNKINVKEKQAVKKGDIIGEVGKTGRATGPHLHWGASLRNTRFTPHSLIDMGKENPTCITLD